MIATAQNIEFIENKGQWDERVRFMGPVVNGAFFVHQDGFTVLQHNAEDWKLIHDAFHTRNVNLPEAKGRGLVLHSHASRVSFVGGSSKSQVIPDKPLYTYNNYFIGNDPS